MPPDPDTDELARRVSKLDELFDELHKVVQSLLEWKSKISGGITVMVWVIGGIQSVVLICLGLAANSLNNTATILGNHAVELATARTRIDNFIAEGPRFTRSDNDAADAVLEAELREWTREQLNRKQQ